MAETNAAFVPVRGHGQDFGPEVRGEKTVKLLNTYFHVGVSALALALPAAAMAQSSEERAQADPNEIIVTATRREQSILDVPMSVAAFSQETLDNKGIRNIEDIARITPGLTISQGFSGIKYIAIRGLSSSVGATMTGLYIDDTPIQVRSLVLMTNFYPALYDLERVEVLRGPQGTLFGAGAMGGAVRFILSKPDLQKFTGNARAEVAITEGGDPSYEGGASFAGPIVQDKIGFRASAYYRRDGGYIDRVPFRPARGTPEKNSNSSTAFVANGALTFKPAEDLTITPSVFFQQANRHDASTYWTYGNGSTRPQPPVFQSGEGMASWNKDRSLLYSLKGQWDVGKVSFISNSAITDRKIRSSDDGTAFLLDVYDAAFGGALDAFMPLIGGTGPVDFALGLPNGGEVVLINLEMRQKAFTQEFRVQSNDPDSPLKYVFGAFYQNSRQNSHEYDITPNSPGSFLLVIPTGPTGIMSDSYSAIRDVQYAAFGQVDWEVLKGLTLTAGIRYSQVEFDFSSISVDPVTNIAAAAQTGRNVEKPWTPKFGLQYEASDNLMFYATAAKGFRSGGINTENPAPECLPSLNDLGLTAIPRTYKADSLWSYEVGAKGRVGSMVSFAADAFTINWGNIQRSRSLPSCISIFTDNYGKARSRGFEAQVTITPTQGLSFDLAVGYVDATQRETIFPLPGPTVVPGSTTYRKGDRFATPWTVSTAADYETGVGSGDTKAYGHIQYDFKSAWKVKPGNIGFNPIMAPQDNQHFISARIGIRTGNGMDLSAFVNNLTNSRDVVGRLHFQPSERIQIQTQRPRTWGATARYRF
jgi:outer membrane receptor protein involved in Fe transport